MKTSCVTGLLATSLSLLSLYPASVIAAEPRSDAIQEVLVTATFRELDILTVPASLTVLNAQVIAERGGEHLQDILNAAPNVNFASGASRGRYVQIRGIGERSQTSIYFGA